MQRVMLCLFCFPDLVDLGIDVLGDVDQRVAHIGGQAVELPEKTDRYSRLPTVSMCRLMGSPRSKSR